MCFKTFWELKFFSSSPDSNSSNANKIKSCAVRHNTVKHSCFSFAPKCVCPQFGVQWESIHYFVKTRRCRKKVEFSLPFQPGEKMVINFFCLKPYLIWLHEPHNIGCVILCFCHLTWPCHNILWNTDKKLGNPGLLVKLTCWHRFYLACLLEEIRRTLLRS